MEFTVQVNVAKESLPHSNGGGQTNSPNGHGSPVALAAMPAVVEQVRSNGRGAYRLHVRMQSRLAAGGVHLLSDEGGSDPGNFRFLPKGRLVKSLLEDYNLEIGGGLGPLKGKIWRVGLMGYGSRPENVVLFLEALRRALD